MSHLPTERLAALADEAPSAAELAHLAGCAECARERAVYKNLAELAATESGRIGAPLTNWESLRPALVGDGIIEGGRRHATGGGRPWLRVAAAVLLVAGGMMGGRYTAGAPVFAWNESSSAVRNAATISDTTPSTFASIEDARAAQQRAQLMFQASTAFLAQNDTTGRSAESPAAMKARLAAFDRASEAMGEALNEAPYDPVINGYYLTTQAQREATLRQINTVVPASMRVISY